VYAQARAGFFLFDVQAAIRGVFKLHARNVFAALYGDSVAAH
jgi:hypothetical protein